MVVSTFFISLHAQLASQITSCLNLSKHFICSFMRASFSTINSTLVWGAYYIFLFCFFIVSIFAGRVSQFNCGNLHRSYFFLLWHIIRDGSRRRSWWSIWRRNWTRLVRNWISRSSARLSRHKVFRLSSCRCFWRFDLVRMRRWLVVVRARFIFWIKLKCRGGIFFICSLLSLASRRGEWINFNNISKFFAYYAHSLTYLWHYVVLPNLFWCRWIPSKKWANDALLSRWFISNKRLLLLRNRWCFSNKFKALVFRNCKAINYQLYLLLSQYRFTNALNKVCDLACRKSQHLHVLDYIVYYSTISNSMVTFVSLKIATFRSS